jgi:hypothetical protein
MEKNHLFTFLTVTGLSVLFIFISVLFVFNTRNSKLLKWKLKIGATIIALTSFVSTGYSQKTCYKPSRPREIININKEDEANYITLYKEDKTISGIIENVLGSDYNFAITDTTNKIIKRGKLVATNGKFDEDKENFEITVGQLKAGLYYIKIYSNSVNFEYGTYLYEGTLHVIDKKEPAIMCYYY